MATTISRILLLPLGWFIFLCFLAQVANTLQCKCSSHSCPGNHVNETCTTEGQCFKKIEEADDGNYELITYGCLPPEEQTRMQCKTPSHVHKKKLSMLCCRNGDMCNVLLEPTFVPSTARTTVQWFQDEPEDMETKQYFILFISAGICAGVFILFLVFLFFRFKATRSRIPTALEVEKYNNYVSPGETLKDMLDQSSGSGSGLPLLVQRTIAKQVTLLQSVGKGRYGEVWRARWRGEDVAVKIFLSHCEASWKRETEIYQTVLLRHESVLGFIASDIIGSNQVTQMYLITDYHRYGSLYDFLRLHQLDKKTTIKLVLSAIAGIAHLHTEILGTKGKPPIAHRDIKSKNILVKENLSCCIADFGLAVKYSPETEEIDIKPDTRVGTRRYMAPEVLDNSIDSRNFAAFKMADMYSFGLVLWEITRRCISVAGTGLCEEYQVPYFDMLPGDPSFDDVKKVVVTEQKRPSVSNRWHRDESLRTMAKLMMECWKPQPAARLTALRVQKTMNKLKKSTEFEDHALHIDDDSPRTSVTTA